MNGLDAIVERRIRAARAAGAFDDLAGRGRPIADLDTERPAGWWAERAVRRERHRQRASDLVDQIRGAMPGLWRLGTEAEVRATVAELNQRIADHNRTAPSERRHPLDADQVVATWQRYRREAVARRR